MQTTEYVRLTPRLMVQLAAPHTWPAAVLPVLFATTLACAEIGFPSPILVLTLLIICILMQSAVNTLNDYFDFIKGADSIDNQDDPTDAVLVYNKVKPRSALLLSLSFIAIAFALGMYVVYLSGWIPLLIGIIGAIMIALYSAGKTPISYLPIGELVSGLTMGGLIPLACYYAFSQQLAWWVFAFSVPIICGISLIMFTNNTCDIEKDIEAGRKTLAVLLGRPRAKRLYHAILYFWIIYMFVIVGLFYTLGLLALIFMLFLAYPTLSALITNPLKLTSRSPAMGNCLQVNIVLGAFYCFAIIFGS